jgi:hypothetical protein
MDDEYENYYFDDAVGGSEGGYSGDQSNYDNNFSDWNFDSGDYNYTGGNEGNMNWFDAGQTDTYGPGGYQVGADNTQYWNDAQGKPVGYQTVGGQFTPYDMPEQGGSNWFDNVLKTGGNALQQLFAPKAQGANTGNGQLDSIIRLLQGGAGAAKLGLGAYSATQEKEKAQKAYEYAKQLQQQSIGALDPGAALRPVAAQAWNDINPRLEQLLSGGMTANMQQELNASRALAERQGGRAGQRFAQFAARQEPLLMAQARKNDFGMQLQALKQRYDEATKGPSSGYSDMMKLPMMAYSQTLTNPMTQWANKSLSDFTGGGSSLDGDTMDKLRALLSKA